MVGADDIAQLKAGLERLEMRMSALEQSRVSDLANVPPIVVGILKTEMPALVRDSVRTVINEERLVADAERFRSIISLSRKLMTALIIAGATGMLAIGLNAWLG